MSDAFAPFVSIDGEAVTIGSKHIYVLMAAAGPTGGELTIRNEAGLRTAECFDFLLRVSAHADPASPLVAFGLNYDVNMWLRDVSPLDVIELWETGELHWRDSRGRGYNLAWIPGKIFRVSQKGGRGRSREAYIADTFGLFQSSFVNALEAWDIDAPETLARMKGERATFTLRQLDPMTHYCVAECRLLSQLMGKVRDTLASVELVPRGWHGAGAVAGELLRRECVNDHRVADEDYPPGMQEAILGAYFGGRAEAFMVGAVGACVGYDIRSAYPSAAASLPPLTDGRWTLADQYQPKAERALWHVRWHLPGQRVAPLPVRLGGAVRWSTSGEGWYHHAEVAAAVDWLGRGALTIDRGYVFRRIRGRRRVEPFGFVPDLYRQRAEHKRRGLASEKVLKLALNSMYGKLAQGLSASDKPPPYRSFLWAGMVTAQCRATMYRLAMEAPESVVSIATDGILFRRDGAPEARLADLVADQLGYLERYELADVFVAQTGVYCGRGDDGQLVTRSRGFFTRELDWPTIINRWRRDGAFTLRCAECQAATCNKHRRFVGAGTCYVRKDWTQWRTWQPANRSLSLTPGWKFLTWPPGDPRAGERFCVGPGADGWVYAIPGTYPADAVPVSQPYKPKTRAVNADQEQGMEQPLVVF